MCLIRAALRLPAKAIAVVWTLAWKALCSHPAWSNPTLIGGFGDPIASQVCLRCGYRRAQRCGSVRVARSAAAGG